MNEESRALEDQRVGFRLVDIPGIPHIGVGGLVGAYTFTMAQLARRFSVQGGSSSMPMSA